jgi:MtaA/CmuA family methyltransferase
MTPKERVFRRLRGESIDKIPNLNILMTFAAKYIKADYKKYVTDYRCLVEGNIVCCEKFGIDMVSAISDPCREAHGFGADIIFPDDDVPQCKDYLIRDYSYLQKLKINNPFECERMLDRINAIKLFKKEVGEKFPILGWVEGPIAESADLRGLSNVMTDIYDTPEFLKKLLEICTQQAILFSREQINAGADFIGIGDAAASLVGPNIYREFVLPYEQRIINDIHQKGAKVKLHICGNVSPILDMLPLTGADMIDVDWMVDYKNANKIFNGICSACGNFDPVKILLQGTEEDIKKAVFSCINGGTDTAFIAAGCEVPKMTSVENLLRVDSSIKEMTLLKNN